jgi:hypothetical protein
MHSAPSVSFPVGRSRIARRLLWCIWALGAAALVAWCVQFNGSPLRTAVLAAVLLLAAAAARQASRLGEGAFLEWNGQHWSCRGSATLGSAAATVHLDLQSLMLVRLQEAGRRAVWFWAERNFLPARWLDLRRALHVPIRTQAGLSDPTDTERRP